MSLAKSSPAYYRAMDELFEQEHRKERDPRDYDADYADWRYHMDRERIEQMEHDKALNEQTNKPKQNDNVDQRSK